MMKACFLALTLLALPCKAAGTGAEIVYFVGKDNRWVAQRRPDSIAYPFRDGVRLGNPPRGWRGLSKREKTPEDWYRFDSWINQAARTYGVDPALLKAILWIESGFGTRAVSKAGARGIAQLMPGTQKRLGVKDPFDPYEAIWGSAAHLRNTSDQFHTMNMAVLASGYNAGDGSVEGRLRRLLGEKVPKQELLTRLHWKGRADLLDLVPSHPETQNYVPNVLHAWDYIQSGRK